MTQSEREVHRDWVLVVLEEYEARLVGYATRLVGDDHLARDVVQHVFMRLCDQSRPKLQGHEAAWLFTVCRNRAIDLLRSRRPAESLSESDSRAQSKEPDPADVAAREDLVSCVRMHFASLPSRQREAIELWAEGLRYREIADVMDQTEGNVRVLVHRGLKQLRAEPAVRNLLGWDSTQEEITNRSRGEVRT